MQLFVFILEFPRTWFVKLKHGADVKAHSPFSIKPSKYPQKQLKITATILIDACSCKGNSSYFMNGESSSLISISTT